MNRLIYMETYIQGIDKKRVKSCARVQSVNTVCHDEQRLIPRPQETSPKRRRHVREVHAPMRTPPNSELPHSRREPMITNNEHVPRNDDRQGERMIYRSDDEHQIQLRGGNAAAEAGDPGGHGGHRDHRDRSERDDRGRYKRRAMGDITQAEHGARNRDRSWSSRRRDSDDGDSSAFRPVGRDDDPPVRRPAVMRCSAAENDLSVAKMYGGVKLDEYNLSTCLETFLVSVKNFATYYHWTPRDELFHLRASLKGPSGQLLWDLGTDISLEKLVDRLKQRFGGADQAERFRTELRIRRRQSGEELPTLYSDVRRLMSLAYPGHDQLESMESVGRDAFLEALDDPELRIRILEKGVKTSKSLPINSAGYQFNRRGLPCSQGTIFRDGGKGRSF